MQLARLLQASVRTLGMILLVVGLMLWNRMASHMFFCLHIFFGGMLTLALSAFVYFSYQASLATCSLLLDLPSFGINAGTGEKDKAA